MYPRSVPWHLLVVPALLLLVGQTGSAQIPNPSFEGWTSGNPDGWGTSNAPPTIVNVIQSADAHSGTKSAQGTVVSLSGFSIAPVLFAGEGGGFPYTSRPGALHGFYKLTSVGGDLFSVVTVLSQHGTGIASGQFTTPTSSAVYREFVANLTYGSSANPDTAYITVQITNSTAHIGSLFIVDDLAYGAATDVKEIEAPESFVLKQNYPNPFNPSTNITFQIPSAGYVSLKVYNLLGQEAATLVNEELQPGSYKATFDGASLPNGAYFYRLTDGNLTEVKEMVLMK